MNKSKKMTGYIGLMLANFLAMFIICGVGNYSYSAAAEFGAMGKVGLIFALETACRCAACPISGQLGEKVGRKNLLVFALILYTVGYAIAAVTHSMTVFLITRVMCGIGWGFWMSNSFIIFCDIFGQNDAPKYSGYAQTASSVAMVIGGPVAGIICGINWRLEFYITVPLLIITTILCAIGVPQSKSADSKGKMDVAGSIFCAMFLVPFSLAMSTGNEAGWSAPITLAYLGIAVVGLIGILLCERKAEAPIFPFHLLRNKFYLAVFMTSFFFSIANAVGNYTPTYLQYFCGVSSAVSGSVGTPAILISLILTPILGNSVAKNGKYKGMVNWWVILTCISAVLYLFVGKAFIAAIPVVAYFIITSLPIGSAGAMQQIVPYTYYMKVLEPKDLAAGGSFLIFSSLFATAVANGVLGAMMNSAKGLVSIYTLPIVCAVGMVIFGLFMFRDIATAK